MGTKGPFLGLERHECGSLQSLLQYLPGLFPGIEQRLLREVDFFSWPPGVHSGSGVSLSKAHSISSRKLCNHLPPELALKVPW